MGWTCGKIEDEWLSGGRVAASSEAIVAAFETVEQLLGRPWLEAQRVQSDGSCVTGASPVAAVVSMGQKLHGLQGAPGIADVLERIRSGSRAARSELTAAHLCKGTDDSVIVEFGVPVAVGSGEKVPDFRLRRGDEPWIYVEVAAPGVSELGQRASDVLEELGAMLTNVPFGRVAEVLLRQDPSESEIADIRQALVAQLEQEGPSRYDMKGLALILVDHAEPGKLVLENHGEPSLPRLGRVDFEMKGGKRKHLAVRYAFSDERAEQFLNSEARQLPREFAALVMVDVSEASGAMKAWEPLLRRRFQPSMHTRVGGVCLFSGGVCNLSDGESCEVWTQVVLNQYATHPAPEWLVRSLESWKDPYGKSEQVSF